jgi:hypothetical protein
MIDLAIAEGQSDEEIFERIKMKEWRSEVFLSQDGILACACCCQPVNRSVCHECGGTIPEGYL